MKNFSSLLAKLVLNFHLLNLFPKIRQGKTSGLIQKTTAIRDQQVTELSKIFVTHARQFLIFLVGQIYNITELQKLTPPKRSLRFRSEAAHCKQRRGSWLLTPHSRGDRIIHPSREGFVKIPVDFHHGHPQTYPYNYGNYSWPQIWSFRREK